MAFPPPACLVWPVNAWPEIDQRLWRAGLEASDALDPVYAESLSPVTLANARKGYGRWLAILAGAGELDPAVSPAARVTRARTKLFLRALHNSGNSNNS